MQKKCILLDLYLTFLKIGGFTLGGGYAMIPIIQNQAVDVKKWVTEEEMTDYITLAQSVPGIIGINTATAVGKKAAGVKGAVASTLGMVTPSVVIIILIAYFFDQFQSMVLIQRAFTGVRAAVVALVLLAMIRFAKASVKHPFQIFLFATSTAAILFLHASPPYVLLCAGALSALYGLLSQKRKKTAGKKEGGPQ